MWPFKRKPPESPEEIAAEQKLDEVTRERRLGRVRQGGRGARPHSARSRRSGSTGAPEGPVKGDPDPGDEHGLREALRDEDEKD